MNDQVPSVETIVNKTAELLKIPRQVLLNTNHRTRGVSDARHTAYYLCNKLTLLSDTKIGEALGGVDHTSVRWGRIKSQKRANADPAYMQMVVGIIDAIEGTDHGQANTVFGL